MEFSTQHTKLFSQADVGRLPLADDLPEMKIGALAPWFGAKRTLAPKIIAEFGPHNCYWEPMCGSCAVLLAKDPVRAETANDAHGGITCLARTLSNREAAEHLYEMLRGVICNEKLWQIAVAGCKSTPPPLDKPDPLWCSRYLYASWLARNGHGGADNWASSFAQRSSAKGGSPTTRWKSVVDSIPAWHERLRNVMIRNDDCFDLIEGIHDEPGTVIYADPPYIEEGGRYLYQFKERDHGRLADALKRFRKARVVVSYYPHEILDRLYSGWLKICVPSPKFLMKAGERQASGKVEKAPEVLLVNGRSVSECVPFFCD